MITIAGLGTWLHSAEIGLDVAIPVLPGSLIDTPGYPDRALFVTSTGGPGLQLDDFGSDVQNFQFRWRGAEGDPGVAYEDTEILAKTLDLKLVRASYPTTIDGLNVLRLWRTGGSPAYLATIRRKVHFTASYLFDAAVG
jgi:hypothetical protein